MMNSGGLRLGLLSLLLWLTGTMAVQAQDFKITKFEENLLDLTAARADVKDNNGDPCALIKFSVRDLNFEYEPNMGVVKKEQHVGETWLFVPSGTKRITIRHPQLGILRDYVIPVSIEKKVVYEAELQITDYSVNKDINILVTFGESQGDFKLGGVRYRILSASAKTVVVEKSTTYSGHLAIPMSVKHDGTDWSVVGVDDNAFNYCTSLISVELPRSLVFDNVGTSLFVGCSSLAAITWNPDYAMTNTMLGMVDNPNLLFYAGSSSYVPSGIANTVVDGKAKSITLQDVANGNGNFYCPKAFTANTITYTHNYTMESAINGVQGWETLALPFDVQKIEHSREGTIVPFIKYHRENADERPFWLYTYGSSGFERSEVIAANHAYIICMPNNSEYDSEYRLNGQVTFSSQNVTVESSSTKYTQRKSDKELCPAFCLQEKSANVYALNVTNDLHGETGNRAPGSAFISNLRDVSPFEAYMTTTTGGSRLVIDIEFDDATGIGFLSDYDIFTSRQYIYSLTGQLVYQGHSREEFQKVLKQLPAGVYIINGRKQQIKK